MFLSSYAPLLALLAWTNRKSPQVWATLAAIAGLSVLGLAVVLAVKRSERGPRLVVARAVPNDGDTLAYIATYLVPFLGLNLTKTNDIVVLVGFLAVVGTIYVNSNMLFVNPLLSLCRYHTFTVTDEEENEYSVITRRKDVEPGSILRPAQIGRFVRLEVRNAGSGSTQ